MLSIRRTMPLVVTLALGAVACAPRVTIDVTPSTICTCTPVQISWDTSATMGELVLVPETTPPSGRMVASTGQETITICQTTQVSLVVRNPDGGEVRARKLIERLNVGEQPMVLTFEPLCSGPSFLGWRAIGNVDGELVAGMSVAEVINTGSQPILRLNHEGLVATNLFPGNITPLFRGAQPEGIWDATTLGRGNCPGSTSPIPGDAPPPQATVMVRCGD